MSAGSFSFDLLVQDPVTQARRGVFHTPRGPVQTPAFMPVGTQGTVKGVTLGQLLETGSQMILANTYHLWLRPGEEVVASLGGLHAFCGWPGPMLTDSGGFQIYSLAPLRRITEEKAVFRSHIDGRKVELSPEKAVQIQEKLGSDVAMVLDHVVALPNTYEVVQTAMERSLRWAKRCQNAATRGDQTLFGIVQGGLYPDLRKQSAQELVAMQFAGYAIGGLSVGESPQEMQTVLDYTVPELPVHKPRYLMGVGRPLDLLESIARGVDLFDCVMPSRNGRNAMAFTDQGAVRIRNAKFERDTSPLEPGCPCPACRHSKGYLRHLFQAKEMLGPILLTAHNLMYYQRLMAGARAALDRGQFAAFMQAKILGWQASQIAERGA